MGLGKGPGRGQHGEYQCAHLLCSAAVTQECQLALADTEIATGLTRPCRFLVPNSLAPPVGSRWASDWSSSSGASLASQSDPSLRMHMRL
jgi:hypothetical protein